MPEAHEIIAVGTPERVLAEISAQTLFDLVGISGLVDKGQAFLVSIAPVKSALGSKWEARRRQIYDHAERHFRKHLTDVDLWERASETHFLVATPGVSAVVGQAKCYRALKDVLTFFLGAVEPADIEINQVTSLSAERIELRPFSIAELEQADLELQHPAVATQAPAAQAALASWPLTTEDGQNLRVSFAVDPIMSLKAWAMAGHRIESRIINLRTGLELAGAERRNLSPRDFEKIDLAALERGMSRLSAAAATDKPYLILQLSFASLSNGRARAAILTKARPLQSLMQRAVICEIVDVESGVPAGRLTEIASLLKSQFRAAWIQVEPDPNLIAAVSAAKMTGLSVRAADLGQLSPDLAVALRRFVAMVKAPNMPLSVSSLPEMRMMVAAHAAGFMFASLRANTAPVVRPS